MSIQDRIKHQEELINIYRNNINILKKRQAATGLQTELYVINEINNFEELINQCLQDIEKLKRQNFSVPTFHTLPNILEKYDETITYFIEEMRSWNGRKGELISVILRSLRRSTNSESVFMVEKSDGLTKCIPEHPEFLEKTSSYLENFIILQGINIDVEENKMIYYKDNNVLYVFFFINRNRIILFINPILNGIDECFEIIIKTVMDGNILIDNHNVDHIEMKIYNQLKERYKYVSDVMYRRMFHLFSKCLNEMDIYFEPIIHLGKHPRIYAWEALARDPSSKKAPLFLFDMAKLWGVRFQTQLDMYFLQKSVDNYSLDNNNLNQRVNRTNNRFDRRRKHTMLPLYVNVYPESLMRTNYFELINNIEEDGFIPLDILHLEISEKYPIPQEEHESESLALENFTKELKKFTNKQIQIVIDDFGVGYASSSRLSRLNPSVVKIDRDALTDIFGDITIKYVLDFVKDKGAGMKVIVEGFDKETRHSLDSLYGMGVHYIQGHEFSVAKAEINDRLEETIYKRIRQMAFGLND